MQHIANRDARRYVERRIPFQGSNLYAETRPSGGYVVYSYGPHWPLLVYTNGVWFANKDSYSQSTSRHFSQCRPYTELRWLPTDWMQRLAIDGFPELAKFRVLEGALS